MHLGESMLEVSYGKQTPFLISEVQNPFFVGKGGGERGFERGFPRMPSGYVPGLSGIKIATFQQTWPGYRYTFDVHRIHN